MPGWTAEYAFHPTRKWRFDYAHTRLKIAVEINGGIWRRKGGAHTGTGHMRDMEKMNAAQSLGWRVFQFTPDQQAEMVKTLEGICS
jgi:very-short-patch-repair endonuclease